MFTLILFCIVAYNVGFWTAVAMFIGAAVLYLLGFALFLGLIAIVGWIGESSFKHRS